MAEATSAAEQAAEALYDGLPGRHARDSCLAGTALGPAQEPSWHDLLLAQLQSDAAAALRDSEAQQAVIGSAWTVSQAASR